MKRKFLLQVTDERPEAAAAPVAFQERIGSRRVQKIKGLLVEKDVLNLLTSCEFALRLSGGSAQVDYATLLNRIDVKMERLRLQQSHSSHGTDTRTGDHPLVVRLQNTKREIEDFLASGTAAVGMTEVPSSSSSSSSSSSVALTAEGGDVSGLSIEEVAKENIPSLSFVVREDGSVDWDEALASTREAARFGAELWERLNGKEAEEGLPSLAEMLGQAQVTEKKQTEEIVRLVEAADTAEGRLQTLLEKEADFKARLRVMRAEGLGISSEDVATLHRMEDKVMELRKVVTLNRLDLDMERVCVYLAQDLEEGPAGGDPLDLKLIVAEVNLIERQLQSVMVGLPSTVDVGTESEPTATALVSLLVDDEELAIIAGKVSDLKNRLGIDTSNGKPIDWGTIGVFAQDNLDKVRDGLSFLGDGTKVLVSDIQYAWKLLLKAASGTTLKAREVNTMRRTGKDVLTLIPFTIILIIPLTPVGHVLVFSFIQRFFPDFFPSCYMEKRLNLRRLYAEIEKRSDADMLGEGPWNGMAKMGGGGGGGGEDKGGPGEVLRSWVSSVGSSLSPAVTTSEREE